LRPGKVQGPAQELGLGLRKEVVGPLQEVAIAAARQAAEFLVKVCGSCVVKEQTHRGALRKAAQKYLAPIIHFMIRGPRTGKTAGGGHRPMSQWDRVLRELSPHISAFSD